MEINSISVSEHYSNALILEDHLEKLGKGYNKLYSDATFVQLESWKNDAYLDEWSVCNDIIFLTYIHYDVVDDYEQNYNVKLPIKCLDSDDWIQELAELKKTNKQKRDAEKAERGRLRKEANEAEAFKIEAEERELLAKLKAKYEV